MLQIISSLLIGTLFGVGLAVSEMIDPARVIGFLDVAGRWDPTLVFVMAGALCVSAPAFHYARRAGKAPALATAFALPTRSDIDAPLVGGAAIFGVGWGLSGLCPGPAIAGLSMGVPPIAAFAASMLAGMALFRYWDATAAARR